MAPSPEWLRAKRVLGRVRETKEIHTVRSTPVRVSPKCIGCRQTRASRPPILLIDQTCAVGLPQQEGWMTPQLLHLVEHRRQRRLHLEGFLDLVSSDEW